MNVWRVRLWFDRVPLVAVGPLLSSIVSRGWRQSRSDPGEWFVDFRRVYDTEDEFLHELHALRGLFSEYWSDADYERIRPYRQTP